MGKIAVVDLEELEDRIRLLLDEKLAAIPSAGVTAPRLLDRKGLAEVLSISPAALDRLRGEPSFPELRIGDAPRFELDRVLEWLRAQSDGPALRVVGGTR
jgi:hypothetical protein